MFLMPNWFGYVEIETVRTFYQENSDVLSSIGYCFLQEKFKNVKYCISILNASGVNGIVSFHIGFETSDV